MVRHSVLIVEDEEDIRELISYNAIREGYHVTAVASGEEALRIAETQPPDLILLDLMLPGVDGLTVCRQLKGNPKTAEILIIMVTAKGEEADIVTGLNLGANDYITKPFSPKVMMARVRAALRRPATMRAAADAEAEEVIEIGNLRIHVGRHELFVDGQPVELTATEFRLLHLFAGRPGWVFTRQQILDGLHGKNYVITERAVDVQIVSLRKRLGPAGKHIETVRGVGYRFKE